MVSIQRGLIASIVAAGTLACAALDPPRPVEAGFWLDSSLTYDLAGIRGPLTTNDIAVIEDAALDEIRRAFSGIAVRVSKRRDARYTVNVVQHLYDLRLRRKSEVFGTARAMRGFGGRGAVNFSAVAGSAVAYAPENATRQEVIDAISRGAGRVAIHEFIHLFLPTAPIDESDDPLSYEYGHAARREQYYGELRWGFAKAVLVREF